MPNSTKIVKMIRNSTRPYIVAYSQVTNFQNPVFYLIIKNFGNAGAVIDDFNCSIDLSSVSFSENMKPFNNICGTFLAPGQSIMSSLHNKRFQELEIDCFTVDISYSDNIKKYEESYNINYRAFIGNIITRASSKDRELSAISYTLQDLVEKSL